jgi:RimJ/RimL family protein N-acetyltransferase
MNPLLLDIPEEFETERLLMRMPRPGDALELDRAIEESRESLIPYLPWARKSTTLEEREEFIRLQQARFIERKDHALLIFRKFDGDFVGGTGLHGPRWDLPAFEIGYWCRKKYEGQGYISEAVRGVAKFAFEVLGAKRVEIRCDVQNERSIRVAERCGFTFEGELRNNGVRVNGEVRGSLVYSMIPEEYEARLK